MRLSALIARLQELAAQTNEDPPVITKPDDHGYRGAVRGATLGRHNLSGRDKDDDGTVVTAVELDDVHFSFIPEFEHLWKK